MGRLTKKSLEAAEIKAKDYFIFDDELSGFGLRVMPSGRKIFVLQYRIGRKARRFTLGHYPVLTVEQARDRAIKNLAAIKDGKDPSGEKQDLAASPTVRDLAQRFQDTHCKDMLKPNTREQYARLLKNHILPELGNYRVVDVTRAEIARLHHLMAKHPSNANKTMLLLSKMFNMAELWGLRPDNTNPCRHLSKYREHKRERYLSADEMRRLGETLRMAEEARLCSPYAVAAFRLLILTGARLGEIRDCKWEYVHLDKGIIRLPDSKTGPNSFIWGARPSICSATCRARTATHISSALITSRTSRFTTFRPHGKKSANGRGSRMCTFMICGTLSHRTRSLWA